MILGGNLKIRSDLAVLLAHSHMITSISYAEVEDSACMHGHPFFYLNVS